MNYKRLFLVVSVVGLLGAFACGDDKKNTNTTNNNNGDCVMNPTTHLQLINACTTAVGVEKNPTLPLLNADGTLPPIP